MADSPPNERKRSPSIFCYGRKRSPPVFCYTSDLVHIIQTNHNKKDYYLNFLICRMYKAFEKSPPSSGQQTTCGFPRKIPTSPIMMEWNNCKENMTIKCVLLVAIILESFDVISHKFRDECWKLLKAMYKLAESFHRLKDYPILTQLHEKTEKNADANPGLFTIVDASFACFAQKLHKKYDQIVLNASMYKKDIEEFQSRVEEAHKDLSTQMFVYILRSQQRRFQCEDGDGREEESKAEQKERAAELEQVKAVLQHLDMEKMEKKHVAVVIEGDSRETKTNLAEAVYDRLEVELFFRGWKLCRGKLTQDMEFNPNVEELHSKIVDMLAEEDEEKKYNGKESHIIQNQSVFICIDNILRAQDLRKILDMELMRPRNVRLLVTSANNNVKRLLAREKYTVQELTVHVPRQENSQAINDEFSDDPVLQEMVEFYNKSCEEEDEKEFHKVFELVDKDDLVETAFNFALEIAFLNLPTTARDGFLDICLFFSGWNWDEVSFIVGESELETLEENAWVKRNDDNQITVLQALLDFGRLRAKTLRFTKKNELKIALSSDETMKQIKGIWLDDITEEDNITEWTKTPVEIPADKLELMSDTLRVLSLGCGTVVKNKCNKPFHKLRFLRVVKLAENFPFDRNQLTNLNYFDYDEDMDFNLSQLPARLKVLKLRGDGPVIKQEEREGITWELQHLRTLQLNNTPTQSVPDPKFFSPYEKLRELSMTSCCVVELPESLTEMYVLEKVDLHDCKYLRKLPESFGTLIYLAKLNLGYCSSLRRLPKSFGELQSLEELTLSYCSALKYLPSSFVWLRRLKKATFSNCHNMEKLPDSFEQLSSLEEVDFSYCNSLKLLPTNFQLLSSLHLLNLQGCSKLEKLPDRFPESLFKSNSVAIKLSACSSLTYLQEGFCLGNNIEDLSLAYCTNLDKLPDQINELRQLRKLNLSHCQNLRGLPRRFKELKCLEVLNLSSCDKLRNLCKGFNGLKALKELNLSNCPVLKCKWIRSLEKIQSLRVVDIRGKTKFKTKSSYHFTVLSDPPDQTMQNVQNEEIMQNEEIVQNKEIVQTEDTVQNQKLLDRAASKFFRDKATLIDLDGRPFFPSKQISSGTTLAFIFDHNISRWDREMLETNVDEFLANLINMQVIYVGRSFSAMPTKLVDRISAYTPKNSKALLLFDRSFPISAGQSPDFWEFGTYIIKAEVGQNEGGFKRFKKWESISDALMGRKFNIQKYRRLEDSLGENFEIDSPRLLQHLLTTKKDELRMTKIKQELTKENKELNPIEEDNKEKVRISALKKNIVFLLISTLEISETQITFLKEMYEEMQDTNHESSSNVEWVWVPVAIPNKNLSESKYKKLAECMPWVVISDPWTMEQSTVTRFYRERMGFCEMPILVSLTPWGCTSTTNVIQMVATLGSKAWLFLNNLSFSDADNNVLAEMRNPSHLTFLFPHVEGFDEKLSTCKMVWLYGGDPEKIGDFSTKLRSVSENIDKKMGIQILYVGRGWSLHDANSREEETALHKKNDEFAWLSRIGEEAALQEENGDFSWSSLSFQDIQRFWHHIHYLGYLIASLDEEEQKKLASIQRLLLALLSLNCLSRRNGTVWMMAIDKTRNNIFTAKGKDLVETLASNIKLRKKSSIVIADGVVEVLTKNEEEEGPWIRFPVEDTSGPLIETKEGVKQRFEDALWLTAHPSSQIVEQISANYFCSMCFIGDPIYQCDMCGCFGICQECYILHFIGRSKDERGEQIAIEVGRHQSVFTAD